MDALPPTVLIIEDNPMGREVATLILEHAGYRVIQAATAREGIDRAVAEGPGLILMDLALPGMDGLEATAALRRDPRTASTPILAFTAHAMSEDIERARQAGCNGCLTKPFGMAELLAAAARWVGPPATMEGGP